MQSVRLQKKWRSATFSAVSIINGIFRFAKYRIAPCGRQPLILLTELFLIQHWIADKLAAFKVFPVHIYSGYLMVGVGGIVIDTSGGITS